jgi:predicted ATPase
MRIYFIGSHSVGKSTLARYASEKYNVPLIPEVARAILSEKELQLDTLRYDMKLVDEYQSAIFYRQLEEEAKHDEFVSDRSFDCLAYAAQHTRILPNLLNSSELSDYIAKLSDPDSFIFFVRPSKATLKADGVRENLTWDGVVAIDAMVKFLLEMWQLRYFQINIDNMQERTRFIDSILSLYKGTLPA